MFCNVFPSSGLGTPAPQSSALLLAKQSFAEVRSQTEFGNEVDGGPLQTAKQLREFMTANSCGVYADPQSPASPDTRYFSAQYSVPLA